MTTLKTSTRSAINSVLGAAGLELRRQNAPYTDYRSYIPLQGTIDGAKSTGLSVGDYIDAQHNVPGSTKETIIQMAELGVFAGTVDRVCEIGPGSGRYLAQTLTKCSPSHYEIYETADEWADWLTEHYDVIAQPTDGKTLVTTSSESIDLVHAHKVMPGQPTLVICRYYCEMARVVRQGGNIVFDIVTEDCLTDAQIDTWLESGIGYQHYPCLVPKQFTIDFFERRGISFVGSFSVPMLPGETECMVFKKER